TGLDSVPDHGKVTGDLPLRAGRPFNRFLLQASADTLVQRLRNRGYPAAEVFRNFAVDKDARTATVSLEVAPGPRSVFGTLRVEGTHRVDTAFVRDLVAARQGRLFSQDLLFQRQRRLYQTELFRFATVGIDSAAYQPDQSVVPLVAQVSEG